MILRGCSSNPQSGKGSQESIQTYFLVSGSCTPASTPETPFLLQLAGIAVCGWYQGVPNTGVSRRCGQGPDVGMTQSHT